jgi:hypothetical protein
MGIYLKLFFKGFLTKAFWSDRFSTFRELLAHPGDYFSSLGKKENAEGAYLLGMASSFLTLVCLVVVYTLTFGLFTLGIGLLFLPVLIVLWFIGWLVGLYILYYLGTWAFATALKWLSGKYEPEKIRPALFAIGICVLPGIVPGIGSVISLIAFCVLLVIAYESILKIERGTAIGSALLGAALLGVVVSLPFWLIHHLLMLLWAGVVGMLGLGFLGALLHHAPAYNPQTIPIPTPRAMYSTVLTPTPAAVPQVAATPTAVPAPVVSQPVKKKKKKVVQIQEDSTESSPIQ